MYALFSRVVSLLAVTSRTYTCDGLTSSPHVGYVPLSFLTFPSYMVWKSVIAYLAPVISWPAVFFTRNYAYVILITDVDAFAPV